MLASTRSAPDAAFELWSRIFGSSPLIVSRSLRSSPTCLEAFSALSPSATDEPVALGFDRLEPGRCGGELCWTLGSSAELGADLLALGERESRSAPACSRSAPSREARMAKKAARAAGQQKADQQRDCHLDPFVVESTKVAAAADENLTAEA